MERSRARFVLALGAVVVSGLALLGANAGTCIPIQPSSWIPVQSDRVSDCGGFRGTRAAGVHTVEADGYCDAEVLRWAFDAAAGVLTLSDERILLNCCGVHGMSVVVEDGLWVVTETDEPAEGGMRCRCLCVYDYSLRVEGVTAGTIDVRLVRFVTEEGERVVWEGAIDLTAGAGAIVLDETSVEPWCE
jgi:hypothetical protein